MINALLKTGPDFDQTWVTIMIPRRHMEVGGNALDSGLAFTASPVSASHEAFCNMIGPMLITKEWFISGRPYRSIVKILLLELRDALKLATIAWLFRLVIEQDIL